MNIMNVGSQGDLNGENFTAFQTYIFYRWRWWFNIPPWWEVVCCNFFFDSVLYFMLNEIHRDKLLLFHDEYSRGDIFH
jgi:hypothetical protein